MTQIVDGIFQSQVEHPFENAVCTAAYFALRKEGNILFYSSSKIEQNFDFLEKMGGVASQYVNHRDEASEYCDIVERRFGAPLHCHILESEAISNKCRIGHTFSERIIQAPDFEIIPTPGHCPGSTCFLLKVAGRRLLFTGDSFYPLNGVWSVAIPDGNQKQMIESLNLLADLDIDGFVPSLFIGPTDYQLFNNSSEAKIVIMECVRRLEGGACH